MHRPSKTVRSVGHLLLYLLALSCVPVFANAESNEAIEGSPIDRLNQTLAKIITIESSFAQVTVDANSRVLQDNQGHLQFKSPSQFRIETGTPFSQVLVSDGSSFWSYDADLEQVVIRDLEQDIKQVPILLLGGSEEELGRNFEVSYFEDEDSEHFILTPLTNEGLFEMLSMEFASGVPIAISITDSLGQSTRITLENVTTNKEIDASSFVFAIPDNVDVIDDRMNSDQ